MIVRTADNDMEHGSFPQVWPDYPNVTVNDSLDWDNQIEVRRPAAGPVADTGEANWVTCPSAAVPVVHGLP